MMWPPETTLHTVLECPNWERLLAQFLVGSQGSLERLAFKGNELGLLSEYLEKDAKILRKLLGLGASRGLFGFPLTHTTS
jgi:hypothetical protein